MILYITITIFYIGNFNPRTAGRGENLHPSFFSNIFTTLANFDTNTNPIPPGSNYGCFGVFRVNVALCGTWRDPENQVHTLWKKWRFSAGRRNFSFQPELPHIFDHNRPEYDESMSLDVVDSALKMAATKPQLEITFGRKLIAT